MKPRFHAERAKFFTEFRLISAFDEQYLRHAHWLIYILPYAGYYVGTAGREIVAEFAEMNPNNRLKNITNLIECELGSLSGSIQSES